MIPLIKHYQKFYLESEANMDYIKLKSIINELNPIDIQPLLDNEYEIEIRQIISELNGSEDFDVISKTIYIVFSDSFKHLFTCTIQDCRNLFK